MDNSMGPLGFFMDIANLGFASANQDYMKVMQQKSWQREDNAVQRRVADLRAAGLSPVLAAGSAASSSSPINVGTPNVGLTNTLRGVQGDTARMQQILTEANIDYVKAQTDAVDANSYLSRLIRDSFGIDSQKGVVDENGNVVQGLPGFNGKLSYDYVTSTIEKIIAQNKADKRSAEEVIRNTDLAKNLGIPSNAANAMDTVTMGRLMDTVNKTGGIFSNSPQANALLYGLLRGFIK